MLIVQPTSTCDVCLERYAWDSPPTSADTEHLSRPHVITCGHVFCQQCLQNLRTPRTCPLCRAGFHLTRAVRIHVDLASPISPTSAVLDSPISRRLTPEEAEARQFELRLVEAFSEAPGGTATSASGSKATTDVGEAEDGSEGRDGNGSGEGEREGESEEKDVEERRTTVVEEARAWLENASLDSHPILRTLLRTVPSHHSLTQDLQAAQAETGRLGSEREHLKRYLRRAERAREQEAALARNSEKTWLVKITEVERECELKLTRAETERHKLEEELTRLKLALKESQAAQSDVLVQAHMQLPDQQTQFQPSAPVPASPHSPRPQEPVEQQQQQREQPQAVPSISTAAAAPGSSSIAFPRTSSPTPIPDFASYGQTHGRNPARDPTHHHDRDRDRYRDYDYSFNYSHNPLPRPPEPVPLSRLPAFARPKPGSSAYSAARALARHGSSLRRREREYNDRARSERPERDERRREERRREKERERESRTDSEKDRRERRREREREREQHERDRERGREREREREAATTDSGKEHRRGKEKGKEKERDRGTDTSATETQDRTRRRERTRHASLVGTSSSHIHAQPGSSSSVHANGTVSYAASKPSSEYVSGNEKSEHVHDHDAAVPAPEIPPDVVGGWGLERSWRASLASSSHSNGSAPVSREDLRTDYQEAGNSSNVGSSYTKMGFRDEKRTEKGQEEDGLSNRDKGKRKERERQEDEEGDDEVREDYVFVRPSYESEKHNRDLEPAPERGRHVSFSTYPHDTHEQNRERDTSHELPPLKPASESFSYARSQYQTEPKGRERERRTTLSAAPSALGLVLVPSPDGRGGYTYAYAYQYQGQGQGQQQYAYPALAPQSTIQTASQAGSAMGTASGKESITPLSSQFQANANQTQTQSRAMEYATLSRRATDSALSAQAQAYGSLSSRATSRQTRAPSTVNSATTATAAAATSAPLHFPQPRRISLTIPEPPESDTSPPPQPTHDQDRDQGQTQTQQGQSFRTDGVSTTVNQDYAYSNKDAYAQRNAGFYANVNPSANMSLDSALASLSRTAGPNATAAAAAAPSTSAIPPSHANTAPTNGQLQHTQTLRHRTSNSSTASASTGISLTGATSKERRKQLLDALFSDSSDPGGSGSNRSSFTSDNANEGAIGIGKRPSLARTLDAPTTGNHNGAVNGDAARNANAASHASSTTAMGSSHPQAARGVPSHDGRPSRGLSTRPSTTQPVHATATSTSSTTTTTTATPAASNGYYAHPQPASSSHVRQAAYPPTASYPTTTGTYTTATQPSYTAYHVIQPAPTIATGTAAATAYAAYAAYYQSQPQHQSQVYTQSHAYAPGQYRAPTVSVTQASGATAAGGWPQDHRQY